MEKRKELAKYDATEAALQSYRTEFLPLTINGIGDREGYEQVRQALLMSRTENANLERTRVALKADSLEYGRAVDAEAKRIAGELAVVIDHLAGEKKRIDDEVARVKFEKEQEAKLPERVAKLTGLGEIVSEEELGRYQAELLKLDDAAFAELVNRLTAEKLERQRVEQERKDREQKAEAARIEAEKKAIEDKRLEAEREERHKAEVEEAGRKAAEAARIQVEIDAKRKEDERIASEKAAKEEAERVEQERPDNEKLISLAQFFRGRIMYPEVSGRKAKVKLAKVLAMIADIAELLEAA